MQHAECFCRRKQRLGGAKTILGWPTADATVPLCFRGKRRFARLSTSMTSHNSCLHAFVRHGVSRSGSSALRQLSNHLSVTPITDRMCAYVTKSLHFTQEVSNDDCSDAPRSRNPAHPARRQRTADPVALRRPL